jgi:amino acid efflux transporter
MVITGRPELAIASDHFDPPYLRRGESAALGVAMAELKRSVGLMQGVALYAGSVLGTGVLILPGVAAETAGPASLLAWLALIVLSVPLALTYAAISVQRPDAGGFSDAIERAFGPRWGAVAGWLFVAQSPAGTVVAALIAGQCAASLVGGGTDTALLLGGALIAAAYVLNFIGLKVSALAQLVTLGVIAAGLAVIVARALPEVQLASFTPFFPRGHSAVGLASVQLFWAFVGWEAITPLAREFKDPRDLWRASLIAVAVVGVLYLSLAIAVIGTLPGAAAYQAPLVQLAARVFGAQASRVVGIAGYLLCFIPVNAYVAGTSRLVFALGERRQLPSWFGTLSPSGIPRRALVALGGSAAIALWVAHVGHFGTAELLPISTSSFLATYVLSMAAAIKLLRPPLAHAAAVSLVACVIVLFFVGPLVLWLAAVAGAALLYQWVASTRPLKRARAEP